MKISTVFAVASHAAVAFGATTVFAQADAIKERMHLMKENGKQAKALVKMVKGQAPYDAKAVASAFAQWHETAEKLPGLFPPDSKTGNDTRAAPAIWQHKKDFDAKAAAFKKAVADKRTKAEGSLDGLKMAMRAVGKACHNCHEDYRLEKH
ncbi:MAG: cytochrome c [Pseudolabrys sp.]